MEFFSRIPLPYVVPAPDTNQTTPIGLNGGRLAEAIKALIRFEDDDVFFGNLYMDDILDMIDWAADITVTLQRKVTSMLMFQPLVML